MVMITHVPLDDEGRREVERWQLANRAIERHRKLNFWMSEIIACARAVAFEFACWPGGVAFGIGWHAWNVKLMTAGVIATLIAVTIQCVVDKRRPGVFYLRRVYVSE